MDRVGVDPDNFAALIDLAAVAVARMPWRDGPIEDWHAGPDSRLGDVEMMHANAATTRLARDLLAAHLPGSEPAGKTALHGAGDVFPAIAFPAIADALTDPDRPMPDGRRLTEIALDRPSLQRYQRSVRTWWRRWAAITDRASPIGSVCTRCCCSWRPGR